MLSRIGSLYENKPFRTVIGTIGVLAVFVSFTEMTLRTTVPLAVMLFAVLLHDAADEEYDLPDGTNLLVYGTSVFTAGAYLAIVNSPPQVGGLLALTGLWFVFDGATTMRYEPSREDHEYVSDLDDDDSGEILLRMQTLNVVYQGLRDASEPQTAAALAADLDLTESRVESALGFMETKGRVDRIENRYRAVPPRWGRLDPAVQALVWLPRRVIRPFRRLAANA
ncbi:hypothetical protein [Halosolutus gelatinilyticus]|uniref:hypothetical protein n=1 Tax=Halosolutus gelatinilyticus TaxID=2931975 RepID=UPI001FF52110|nr:hypothetical protein [Halosolutus gelatinilyticus]